jgi:hypothetical protein
MEAWIVGQSDQFCGAGMGTFGDIPHFRVPNQVTHRFLDELSGCTRVSSRPSGPNSTIPQAPYRTLC